MRQCHNGEAIGGAALDELAEPVAMPDGQAAGKWFENRECDNAAMQQCHNGEAIGGAALDERAEPVAMPDGQALGSGSRIGNATMLQCDNAAM